MNSEHHSEKHHCEFYLASLRERELSGDQKSAEWLSRRHNFITASVVAACAGLTGDSTRTNVLLDKASFGQYGHFGGGYYTDKGNIFEKVTNTIYCQRNMTSIHEFGLIPHKDIPFLGASTDGVTESLVNIEIKTLAGREVDDKIKKDYYHQTQLQMECLGLENTDFIEAKYTELLSSQEFYETFDPAVEQGIIIEYWNTVSCVIAYLYSPCCTDAEAIRSWYENCESSMQEQQEQIHVRDIYWRLKDFSCKRIARDPTWTATHLPKLKKFWQEVESLRANPAALALAISSRENQRASRRKTQLPDMTLCML